MPGPIRQYGAPKPEPGQQSFAPADGSAQTYAERSASAAPAIDEPDPSPTADIVVKFHKNVPVDTRPEDIHHTLGFAPDQAAKGDHDHRGEGTPLFDGQTITGSRGGNAAVASIIQILVAWGAKDSTTA